MKYGNIPKYLYIEKLRKYVETVGSHKQTQNIFEIGLKYTYQSLCDAAKAVIKGCLYHQMIMLEQKKALKSRI